MVLYQLSAGHDISEIIVVEYFLLCGSAGGLLVDQLLVNC